MVDVLVNCEPGWNGTSPGVGLHGRPRMRVLPSTEKTGTAHVVTFPLAQVAGCGCLMRVYVLHVCVARACECVACVCSMYVTRVCTYTVCDVKFMQAIHTFYPDE